MYVLTLASLSKVEMSFGYLIPCFYSLLLGHKYTLNSLLFGLIRLFKQHIEFNL